MARYNARVGRALTILLAAAVVTVISPSPSPAGAEPDPAPGPPASAQEAQRQWLTAARDGAVLNEQVLQAQATLDEATARSVAAAESVDEARAEEMVGEFDRIELEHVGEGKHEAYHQMLHALRDRYLS